MKYASNTFVETQEEIIRPPYKNMVLYVGTDNCYPHNAVGGEYNTLGFDTNVAPVVPPSYCRDVSAYAVLGMPWGVDSTWRVCAPEKVGGSFPKPNRIVPYGVSVYANANEEVIIGNPVVGLNFNNIKSRIGLQFTGGHYPKKLVVEWYNPNTGNWQAVGTYTSSSPSGSSYWWFRYNNFGSNPENWYTRFKVSSDVAGRFQLSFLMDEWSIENDALTVIFNKAQISKVNITQETDLSSQSLPTNEMTVEVLDINEEYTPDSEYWSKQFKERSPILFTVVNEANGYNEYIDLFIGRLTKEPNYEQGKITFNIAVELRKGWDINLAPPLDDSLSVGDSVPSQTFHSIIFNNKLFDDYSDAFIDADDMANSLCNTGGDIDSQDARQLIANALGCYIKIGINTVNLENANNVQYKPIDDWLTRYSQVKYLLDSKPKVGKINVLRMNNTVAADYVDVECPDRKTVGSMSYPYALFDFELPFFATGKFELINAQSSEAGVTVSQSSNSDVVKLDNGNYKATIPFTADEYTTIKPIVRFYKTESTEHTDTEIMDDEAGEVYENNNNLVTNSYIAGKVNRVAHLVSDISNQYEVDVVQDLRYEVGDIIRLETRKNVYKTCVITGLKFNLPGCNGHITCRKIFSLLDGDFVVDEPKGLSLSFGVTSIEVESANEAGCIVGIMNTQTTRYIYVLGVENYKEDISGTITNKTYNATLTDNNGHIWKFAHYSVPSGVAINTGAPIVYIPEYDPSSGATQACYGAVALLKALYNEQGMNAPADYSNEWEII